MKKYIITVSLFVAAFSFAQVAIEKTSVSGDFTLLEFNDERTANNNGKAKGIILPIVESIDTNTEEGTIYVDAATDKVVYTSSTGVVEMTPKAAIDLVSPTIAEVGEGAIITNDPNLLSTDNAPAVLKLSSSNSALMLPLVNTTDSVINPEPGTIVYEKSSKSLAVFNGTNWSFWNK